MASGLITSPIQATARTVARTPPRAKYRADAPEEQHDRRDDGERQERRAGSIDSGRFDVRRRRRRASRDRRRPPPATSGRGGRAEAARAEARSRRARGGARDQNIGSSRARWRVSGAEGEQDDAARKRQDGQQIVMGEHEERPADEQDEHA